MRSSEVVKGTVVGGKVILNGKSLPEGTEVVVFVACDGPAVRLPPHLQRELQNALEEAD